MSDSTGRIYEKSLKLCPVLKEKLFSRYSTQELWDLNGKHPLGIIRKHLIRIPVIVRLKPNYYVRALKSGIHGDVLGCAVRHRMDLIRSFSTIVSVDTLEKLIQNDPVVKVWYDREVRALLNIAKRAVNAPLVWRTRLKGEDIGIAVLDSGVYPHPDLTKPHNRIVAFKDFVNGKTEPYDDNGHGTHCAGCAAGNGYSSGGKYSGPAPRANIIGVKVIGRKGAGKMSDLIAGIDWCTRNRKKYNIRVLSISLGTKAVESYKDDPVCRAVARAGNSGMFVCSAAGNEGPVPGTINSPGIAPEIITVGASDDNNTVTVKDDKIAYFSGRGPTIDNLIKPDLVAPGVNITGPRVAGAFLDKMNRKSRTGRWYATFSGTSAATPICAGVAALVIQNRPYINPEAVKKALTKNCHRLKLDVNSQGAGIIDAYKAVVYAKK